MSLSANTSRFLDFKFKKWGDEHLTMQHFRIMHLDKEVAVAIRTGKSSPDWYVLPSTWTKGVQGLRSREAVVKFLQQFYVDNPWRDEPGMTSYIEYSVDGKSWTRTRPDGQCHARFVGVSLAFNLKEQDND